MVHESLSRREREIVDALYRLGSASAAEVATELGAEESFQSIRVTLGILARKGHVKQKRRGVRNVYSPAVSLSRAKRSALRHLLQTFFGGSSSQAILTLLDQSSAQMSDEELDAIAQWIDDRKDQRS